jgi:tetratricopeptide (TPR) repeat protein
VHELYASFLDDGEDGDFEDDHDHGHDEHDHQCPASEVAPVPALVELAGRLAPRYRRWMERENELQALEEEASPEDDAPEPSPESKADVLADAALAEELLSNVPLDPLQVHVSVEHVIEGSIWGWLLDLPARLSDAGEHDRAARLSRRVDEAGPTREKYFRLPLYLARAGHREEALARIDENLAACPEDMLVLRYAGEALLVLRERQRAAEMLEEALYWSGGNLEVRTQVLDLLLPLLVDLGRRDRAVELMRDEEDRLKAMAEELDEEPPEPIRREGPNIGRNDPCPCGSGKKYKRCHGA